MPRKIWPIGTSGTSDFTMNTFIPTGGVIIPISRTITMIIPNQLNIPTLVSWLGGTNVPTLNSSAVIEFEKNQIKLLWLVIFLNEIGP